jgi:RND family efflux transporter MFP subunit
MPGMGMPTLFDQFFTRPLGDVLGQGDPDLERRAQLFNQSTQVEQARNAFMRAQAQIQQLQAKLRDARSIAPFAGVITRKMVDVGDTVQPGQPLLEFADMDTLQVEVDVPARLMPLRQGQVLDARLDVGNRPIKVRVARVFPMADPERHTVTVKFDVEPGAPAAPGMYAEVKVPDPNAPVQQVVVVPVSAIVQRGSLPMVEVATGDGEKELRIVRLGEYVDARHVTVLSGLKPGEVIYARPGGSAAARGGGGPSGRGY